MLQDTPQGLQEHICVHFGVYLLKIYFLNQMILFFMGVFLFDERDDPCRDKILFHEQNGVTQSISQTGKHTTHTPSEPPGPLTLFYAKIGWREGLIIGVPWTNVVSGNDNIVKVDVHVLRRCPIAAHIDIEPHPFDFQAFHISEPNIGFLESQPAVDPSPKHTIVIACAGCDGIHLDIDLYGIPLLAVQVP